MPGLAAAACHTCNPDHEDVIDWIDHEKEVRATADSNSFLALRP